MPKKSKRERTTFALPTLILRISQPIDLLKKTLIIVILSFLITLISVIPLSIVEIGAVAPFPESEYGTSKGAFFNLFFYLVLVIGATFFILFLLKRKKFNILSIILVGSLSFSTGSIASLIVPLWISSILNGLSVSIPDLWWYGIIWGVFILFLLLPVILFLKPKYLRTRNGLMILIGAWVGSFLTFLGEMTPLVLMAGFAIYDVFSVFKGPLGEMVKELQKNQTEERRETDREQREIMLGLGDLVFYGIATSYSWIYLSLLGFLLVLLTLVIGLTLTLYFLVRSLRKGKRSALPALPLPIFLALAVIVVFKFLI